jgi:hypothetical protein
MATTSAKRRPQRAQRQSGTGQGSNRARAKPAEPTKAATKPDHEPHKAHKPEAAAKSGEPHKAHKPEAATKSGRPRKAHRPKAAREATHASNNGGRQGRDAESAGHSDGLGGSAKKAEELGGPAGALVKAASPGGGSIMQKLILKVGKALAKRAASKGADKLQDAEPGAGTEVVRHALSRGVEGLQQSEHWLLALSSTSTDARVRRRPPIQCMVEAGVPVRVAWEEWMALAWLPEGVARVFEVKRRGKTGLRGRLDAGEGPKWSAKILDEREQDSFAWQSLEGTDCAGLITFHSLGETLTRIEVNLDVVPRTLPQAAALSTRLADRRTQADLRRFKARLELINPDLYEDDETQAG